MPQSTPSEAVMSGRNPNGHYRPIHVSPTWEWIVAQGKPVLLSRAARVRLSCLQWHEANGRNVALTSRHFGIPRQTFYRWQRRFQERGVVGLEDRSHRPHHARRPTWAIEQVEAVREVRKKHLWGKLKIQTHLLRRGISLSVSMVGRIIRYLKRRGLLREPPHRRRKRTMGWHPRPWARRKPREWIALRPGDLVQVDTKDVRPVSTKVFKHLSLIDVCSRYCAAEVGIGATAKTIAGHLDRMLARLPFKVCALQVDGGSEFKADFERYCQDRGLELFVLPPRSPKLNGCVERLQRTFDEEFYQRTDALPNVASLTPALRDYETIYNTVRPHHALGLLTPHDYLQSIGEAP